MRSMRLQQSIINKQVSIRMCFTFFILYFAILIFQISCTNKNVLTNN